MSKKFNTGNPLGSADPRDLFDNSKNLDEFVNSGDKLSHPDRLGVSRRTWHGMETDFETALLSYQAQVNDIVIAGGQIFESEEAGREAVQDGQYYYSVSDDPNISKITWKRINSTTSQFITSESSSERVSEIAAEVESIPARTSVSSNLEEHRDIEGNLYAYTDPKGDQYLKGLGRLSVQERLKALQPSFAPAILQVRDSEDRILESIDSAGGLRLPDGYSHAPMQRQINDLRENYKQLAQKGRVLRARDCGIDVNGKHFVDAQLNLLITRLSAMGGGVITFSPGDVVKIADMIRPQHNVSIIGGGMYGQTRFLPFKDSPAFYYSGVNDPLYGCFFDNFTIDGENQHIDPSRGYIASIKGMYFKGFARCGFNRLHLANTGATSLGIDFARDGNWITNLLVENGGRLGEDRRPGASGIGIGSGIYLDEPLFIAMNRCIGNKNFGIFHEWQRHEQATERSRLPIIAHNICTGNGNGIGDAGVDGAITIGNQVTDNRFFGIAQDTGTLTISEGRPSAGSRGIVALNQVLRNGEDGIHFDGSKVPGLGGMSYSNNEVAENGGFGYRFLLGENSVPDVTIDGGGCDRNGQGGLSIASGELDELEVRSLLLRDNNGPALTVDGHWNGGRLFGCSMKDRTGVGQPTFAGSGTLTDVDISENRTKGMGANTFSGTTSDIAYGRNPNLEQI